MLEPAVADASLVNLRTRGVARVPTEVPEAERQARDVVTEAWRNAVLHREREKLISTYATKFEISRSLAHEIHTAAVRANIDPEMAFGLVRAESSFRPRAVSPVGALGLTQVMPSTARWLEPGMTRKQLIEPRTNLRVGFGYLRQLLDKYNGNERLALTAYNRGPGKVNSLLRRGRAADNGYADFVLTGRSDKHFKLMRAKFGRSRRS